MGGVRIDHDAWVLVGDGEKALVFRNEGDADYPNLQVVRVLAHENPMTHEQGTDAPGRYIDGLGPNRSAVEPTDWHRLEKHRFAKEIAEAMYKAAHAGRYSKLIVAAPPTTLGDLRKAFHKEVTSRIVAELDKTLTGHPPDQIEKILTKKG
ncbi:host attachment protein [Stappia sp. F7233]|uniref:Host attachment protein n=1 Tax=Stappia albiluteola TaxID=2758565 RepID=A0A839AJG8_9HYPH|nr:host attachment family protein [Stappia albiluteola]MBA5778639.1 host attachment protein [Stappia albiluteola]